MFELTLGGGSAPAPEPSEEPPDFAMVEEQGTSPPAFSVPPLTSMGRQLFHPIDHGLANSHERPSQESMQTAVVANDLPIPTGGQEGAIKQNSKKKKTYSKRPATAAPASQSPSMMIALPPSSSSPPKKKRNKKQTNSSPKLPQPGKMEAQPLESPPLPNTPLPVAGTPKNQQVVACDICGSTDQRSAMKVFEFRRATAWGVVDDCVRHSCFIFLPGWLPTRCAPAVHRLAQHKHT